jgi:hypothetical protein
MSRIATPAIAGTPAASQLLLDGVKKQLGIIPNLFRVIGNSRPRFKAISICMLR